MSFHLSRIVVGLALAGVTACATKSGGGSNTSWVACATSNDCEVGYPCVDHECQEQPTGDATYSLEVRVTLPADDQNRGLSIGWLGEAAASGDRSLRLVKTFGSRKAALAFGGTYVISRDGTELARETVGFANCDPLDGLGVDPGLVRGVIVSRSWDNQALSLDTHSNTIAPAGCFLSPPPSSPLPTGPRRVLFRVPSNDRLSFSYAGESVLPRSVQLFPDTKLWEVPVYVREASGSSLGELDVLKDGEPFGSVPVSFDACRFDGKPVVEEQLRLTATNADAGPQHIAVDTTAGVSCLHSDGSGSSAIP